MMKSKITAITALVFIGTAIFSVLLINQMEAHNSACVPTMIQGSVCPKNSLWGILGFHMNGFRLFFSGALQSVLTLFLLLAATIFFFSYPHQNKENSSFFKLVPTKAKNHTTYSLLKWHSLRERSPENP